MICEDESASKEPIEPEPEQWKCDTCVFECHKKCIKKWVHSSLHGNCPYCRSQITTVYTREEMIAMLFVLCLSRDTQSNPVPAHATYFSLASELD